MRKETIATLLVVAILTAGAGYVIGVSNPRTVITTMTLFPATSSGQAHLLAFYQQGVCSPPVIEIPWEVVLNGKTTMVEPENASLPIQNYRVLYLSAVGNLSIIAFYVPNGVYTYDVEPAGNHHGGTVTLNGAPLVVAVEATVLCTSISTSSG